MFKGRHLTKLQVEQLNQADHSMNQLWKGLLVAAAVGLVPILYADRGQIIKDIVAEVKNGNYSFEFWVTLGIIAVLGINISVIFTYDKKIRRRSLQQIKD